MVSPPSTIIHVVFPLICSTAVMGATTTTTVVSTQYPQQPVVHGSQYPPYQPVKPPQFGYSGAPGYGGQPMPTAPYQGPPYVAGPPPPYQEAGKIMSLNSKSCRAG